MKLKKKKKRVYMVNKPKKILILGSGALKIGEAGEFDYSGSQAIKALKEEGIKTVLVNPNIATIQTSEHLADKVYFLPVTPYFVEKVIKKEKPDGLFLSFGGQTALNCGVELFENKVLEKYNVKVLGTPVRTIINTEDRELFSNILKSIDVSTPKSFAVENIDSAIKAADKIGYPIMIRAAYTLGGRGSGVAENKKELIDLGEKAFAYAPQILVEEYLKGWKEVEYEVVRDSQDNCITVCNMENFDPMGIHTGDSIVVAPSQTLTNSEYHKLRSVATKVIRHLGIIGECNIQYALAPDSEEYRVIEVNARLSRSSALASKATGYPLAFVAAKLALGYSLTEVKNSITHVTSACFEPALDYIVVKIPRWDLQKFTRVGKVIGSGMKSVGEIMAIGRSFEEVIQKGLRMIGQGLNGLVCNTTKINDIDDSLINPTDKRILGIAQGMLKGKTVDEIHELTQIDKWFLYKLENIVKIAKELKKSEDRKLLLVAKKNGFSDKQISIIRKKEELDIRKLRKKHNIVPSIKQIDTLAGEFPAATNYLYMTYHGDEHDVGFDNDKSVIVLGGGAYRIGSSVEFDWCCVNSVMTLKKLGYKTIMINFNPETVSTDYDTCDKLYFDEISFETVLDIYELENPEGVIISTGGQIPNNLAMPLHDYGVKILGTSPKSIDNAEDRNKFSALLDKLSIDQPEWASMTTYDEAKKFAKKVNYPVLVRPSYVLSGSAMSVITNEKELSKYLKKAVEISKKYPVVISKFYEGAKEIEMDAVAAKGEVICYAISEHIENAGVHSGDATMIFPPQRTYYETMRRIKKIGRGLAKELNITGPFNMQFLAKNNEIKVIELNLRASRSFPFVSKILKLNFIDIATKVMVGEKVIPPNKNIFEIDYVGIKAPQFSFSRLLGADPITGVEMASTGEVACIGEDIYEALLKSMISVGYDYPKKNILLSTGPINYKAEFLKSARYLVNLKYNLFSTHGTHEFLKENGIDSTEVDWPLENGDNNAVKMIKDKVIDFVINVPKNYTEEELTNDYLIRRAAVDYNVPLITNIKLAKLFIASIARYKIDDLKIMSWDEYKYS
jgi:carbamoyl-phosphate synthase large subunit